MIVNYFLCFQALVSDNFFLIADAALNAIIQIDAQTGNLHSIDTRPHPALFPAAVTYDHAEGRIYWSDWILETINSANLDGSDAKVIVNTGESMFIQEDFSRKNCKCVYIFQIAYLT